MPKQGVNDAPDQLAGRVGSVRPRRRGRGTPHTDIEGIRPGVSRVRAEQGPHSTSKAMAGRPPKVIWQFAPDDQSRLQRVLQLLFE